MYSGLQNVFFFLNLLIAEYFNCQNDVIEINLNFCAIVLYLVVYHVCFQDGKLCLLVANDKLDGK
jgi:hypothetical protein